MSPKLKYATIFAVTVVLVGGILAHDIIAMRPKAEEAEAAPIVEAQPTQPIAVVAEAPVVTATSEPAVVTPTWHYYNLDLQDNGIDVDDLNFGPPPQVTEANNLDQELRSRMREDPVLGAAVMAWADSILGTDYLGVFFSECDEEWDAAINKAAHTWIGNKEDYDKTLDAFFKHLDRASISLKEEKGLSDQMYMNPDTKDNIPKVVVLESDDHIGKFLVYTFTIKGTTKKEVKYRIDCGFQPTNVAKIMKVSPGKKVVGPTGKITITGGGGKAGIISGGGGKSGGGGSDPKPTPKPTPPTPKPTPTPIPKKDPTKGTPVLPNDVPGPGPDTNTGPGGQYSSKDLPGNSNDLTPEEYQKIIQQMQDANQGSDSQPGGTPNNPSTPTPADTTPDNNGDAGTGNGGIDEPTPVAPGPVDNDPPGEAWDGPPDA